MNSKPATPWTAGRKKGDGREEPRVVCVGGRCTWEIGWLGAGRPARAKVRYAIPLPARAQP